MAKLTDKFFNRVIEGPFSPDSDDASAIAKSLEGKDLKVKKLETTSDAKIGGKVDVTGNANIGGNLVVTGSVNGEENPSVKPIYYHPINIRNQSLGYISMLILDNSQTAYTKESFLTKIANFERITPLSGAVINANTEKTLICAYAHKQGAKHYILGLYTDGTPEDTSTIAIEDIVNNENTSFADGVNKIN